MSKGTAIIVLNLTKKNITADIEVPLNISANEFVFLLSSHIKSGQMRANIQNCYLKAENPIALLRGNKSLMEFGLRNGSVINYTE